MQWCESCGRYCDVVLAQKEANGIEQREAAREGGLKAQYPAAYNRAKRVPHKVRAVGQAPV